jgi:hypothetical protein
MQEFGDVRGCSCGDYVRVMRAVDRPPTDFDDGSAALSKAG